MRPYPVAAALGALYCAAASEVIPKEFMDTADLRSYSLKPPYLDSDLSSAWWNFGGDIVINTLK